MLTLNSINGCFSPQRRSSISARPDSKSVSAAEKVTVEGREGKQLTCRGPSGCSTRLSYVILQWISLSLSSSTPTALLSHNIEMLHALHDLKHPALIIYQWRHPFPSLPFPTLNLRKSAFQLRSRPSSPLIFFCSLHFFFFFYDHKALWVHNAKLWTYVVLLLPRVQHLGARQATPLLEFPRSCERSQQSVADASGFQICDFSGTASAVFFFFMETQVSICVPFHGRVWKLFRLLSGTGGESVAAEWNAARL